MLSPLTQDFHRTGFGKVLMDPAVRVAYDWVTAPRVSCWEQVTPGLYLMLID
jgi:hypothetical protein